MLSVGCDYSLPCAGESSWRLKYLSVGYTFRYRSFAPELIRPNKLCKIKRCELVAHTKFKSFLDIRLLEPEFIVLNVTVKATVAEDGFTVLNINIDYSVVAACSEKGLQTG